MLFFIFFVKCPGSSITYKHDLYRGVDGKAGTGGVTGDAPLLAAPLGLGPFSHFRGRGHPNTSLRLSDRLCPWCSESRRPLDSRIASWTPSPLGTRPLVLHILPCPSFRESPLSCWGAGSPPFLCPLTPEEGGKGGGGGLRSPLRGRWRGRWDQKEKGQGRQGLLGLSQW